MSDEAIDRHELRRSCPILPGQLYRHFKGTEYEVDLVGVDANEYNLLVAYSNPDKPDDPWVRTSTNFLDVVSCGAGVVVPRFTLLGQRNRISFNLGLWLSRRDQVVIRLARILSQDTLSTSPDGPRIRFGLCGVWWVEFAPDGQTATLGYDGHDQLSGRQWQALKIVLELIFH